MSALRLQDVGVVVGRGVETLRDLNLEVEPGEWLAVVGPNGAGKSTLLRAAAGLVPAAGEVTIGGRLLRRLTARERARLLAYAPQAPILPPEVTVAEYLLLGRAPHLGRWAREGRGDRAIVAGLLERLGLADRADQRLVTLSGGEQRLAVLGRALAQQPRLVLLDEPTSGLDLGHQQLVLDLLDEVRAERGLTVVAVLHDLTLASHYADQVLLLVAGEVVGRGTPAEVLTAERLTAAYQARLSVGAGDDGSIVIAPQRRPLLLAPHCSHSARDD